MGSHAWTIWYCLCDFNHAKVLSHAKGKSFRNDDQGIWMRYLKSHAKGKIIYNVREPDYLNIRFADHNWDDLYPGAMEEIAPKWPKPKGKEITLAISLCGCGSCTRWVDKEICYRNHGIPELYTDKLVHEKAGDSGKFNIWIWTCSGQNCYIDGYWDEKQSTCTWDTSEWTILYVRRQHVRGY